MPSGVLGSLPDSPTTPPPSPAQEPVRIAPKPQGAVPIVKILPVYPEVAERQRVQGVAILDVEVFRNRGQVDGAASSGSGVARPATPFCFLTEEPFHPYSHAPTSSH